MRRRRKAAGEPQRWLIASALIGVGACGAPAPSSSAAEREPEPASVQERTLAALEAWEEGVREATDFAAIPASDSRFGADPHRILALPGDGGSPRFAVLERGHDQLSLVDAHGQVLSRAPTVHQPTSLVNVDGELWVAGLGDARLERFTFDGDSLQAATPTSLALPAGASIRDATLDAAGALWLADEGHHRLLELAPRGDDPPREHPSCRGPLQLEALGEGLIHSCLLAHRVHTEALDITHDGPIWAFALAPPPGPERVALVGVEDHPLERAEGGFGYIDSFLFIRELGEGRLLAAVDLSAHGVVTPKWVRWLSPTRVAVTGYASDVWLELEWATPDCAGEPTVSSRPWLPGTTDVAALPEGRGWLATNALFDALVRVELDDAGTWTEAPEPIFLDAAAPQVDDRSFEERLGELLVFTTAMAPRNDAEGKRSRFTCETCHFEGRGDGRVHFTGREREGQRVHARSKAILGLFPNRPHFSRALDRTLATMVHAEFRVANRFSADPDYREGWFTLDADERPWLAQVPGWSGPVDPPALRRALMRFFMRASMPQNPRARGRSGYTELEREGAEAFAARCEGCHQARLVTDDPSTRQDFERWEALIFAEPTGSPIVWASEAYAQTSIGPWVHDEGARVASLRRLNLIWPYFTTGEAESLEAVVEGVRVGEGGTVDHDLGPLEPKDPRDGLGPAEREALVAFLRLL